MSDNMYKTADLVVTEGQTGSKLQMTDDGRSGAGYYSALFCGGRSSRWRTRITKAQEAYALRQSRFLSFRESKCSRHALRTVAAARSRLSYDEQLRIKRKNIITSSSV